MINNNLAAYSCIKYMIDNNIIKINCFDLYNEYGNQIFNNINKFINFCHKNLTDNFEIQLTNRHLEIYEHIPYFLFHSSFEIVPELLEFSFIFSTPLSLLLYKTETIYMDKIEIEY